MGEGVGGICGYWVFEREGSHGRVLSEKGLSGGCRGGLGLSVCWWGSAGSGGGEIS